MIAWRLILDAAAITAAAVAVAVLLARWEPRLLVAAACGSFLLVLGWRAIANGVQWHDDFVRLVSVGDVGCLFAGAAAPALVARGRQTAHRALLPVVVAGVVGFVINVVIL